MTWVALVLTLLAIPLSILHRPLAVGLLAIAAGLLLTTRHRGRLFRVVAVLTVAAIALTAVSVVSMALPRSPAGPDLTAYERDGGPSREVRIPLTVTAQPVTGAVLMNFPAGSDPVYNGLEPQLVDGGVRVVAYRHGGFIDVHDDATLLARPDQQLSVTGQGRANYRHAPMKRAEVGIRDDRLIVDVAFTDVAGRAIEIAVDSSIRDEQAFPMLAPVGLSTANPDYLPLFLLNDFHFLRTDPAARIDGRLLPVKPFPAPVPIRGHVRSGACYSLDTDMLEVFPTGETTMPRARTSSSRGRRHTSSTASTWRESSSATTRSSSTRPCPPAPAP